MFDYHRLYNSLVCLQVTNACVTCFNDFPVLCRGQSECAKGFKNGRLKTYRGSDTILQWKGVMTVARLCTTAGAGLTWPLRPASESPSTVRISTLQCP